MQEMSKMPKTQKLLDVLSSFKKKMVEASQLQSATALRFDGELRALYARLKNTRSEGASLNSRGFRVL